MCSRGGCKYLDSKATYDDAYGSLSAMHSNTATSSKHRCEHVLDTNAVVGMTSIKVIAFLCRHIQSQKQWRSLSNSSAVIELLVIEIVHSTTIHAMMRVDTNNLCGCGGSPPPS